MLHIIYRYGEKRKGSESAKELSGVALLSATMNQCKKANQQLLVPITVWIGMEQAFIGADFTQVSIGLPSRFCRSSLYFILMNLFPTRHTYRALWVSVASVML